ncbi:MAG TPA: hypothetical protein VE684_20930 [Crenalkalicoccus sp.]|jgi:hypothetical protein|nr:hypothetical protein [Crenalkalicoccus sp.]
MLDSIRLPAPSALAFGLAAGLCLGLMLWAVGVGQIALLLLAVALMTAASRALDGAPLALTAGTVALAAASFIALAVQS